MKKNKKSKESNVFRTGQVLKYQDRDGNSGGYIEYIRIEGPYDNYDGGAARVWSISLWNDEEKTWRKSLTSFTRGNNFLLTCYRDVSPLEQLLIFGEIDSA
jgi:hypothetical protein